MVEALALFKGFALGGGLIVAIGAQNAYLLGYAIRGRHELSLAFVFALFDALLILIGVLGLGEFIKHSPNLLTFFSLAGALFLFWYGLLAFKRAYRPVGMQAQNVSSVGRKLTVLLTGLGISVLNPHVYLDTVLLVGSVGAQLPVPQSAYFAVGAICASFVWFFSLAFAGRLLAPLFENPRAWKILDTVIGVFMWVIALSLLRTLWR